MKKHLEVQFWLGVAGGSLCCSGIASLSPPPENPGIGIIFLACGLIVAGIAGYHTHKVIKNDR